MHGNSYERKLSIVKGGGTPALDVRCPSSVDLMIFCHFEILYTFLINFSLVGIYFLFPLVIIATTSPMHDVHVFVHIYTHMFNLLMLYCCLLC